MAKVERFEDLEVWRLARAVTSQVYALAKSTNLSKDHGLRDQICRAAVSVMSNIAEGFERRSDKSMMQFAAIARGSAGELRSQLYVALDAGYFSQEQFSGVYAEVVRIGKMLTRLIGYYRAPSDDPTIRRSDDSARREKSG